MSVNVLIGISYLTFKNFFFIIEIYASYILSIFEKNRKIEKLKFYSIKIYTKKITYLSSPRFISFLHMFLYLSFVLFMSDLIETLCKEVVVCICYETWCVYKWWFISKSRKRYEIFYNIFFFWKIIYVFPLAFQI